MLVEDARARGLPIFLLPITGDLARLVPITSSVNETKKLLELLFTF